LHCEPSLLAVMRARDSARHVACRPISVRKSFRPMSALGHSRLRRTGGRFGHVRCAPKSGSKISAVASAATGLRGLMVPPARDSSSQKPRIMRYELTDYEWAAIKPMLPNKPRGVPRVNDRRVLNGIFWVLRSGAPWRDLPESYGPYTTCYNRFDRGTAQTNLATGGLLHSPLPAAVGFK
jgi:hypothetical protein